MWIVSLALRRPYTFIVLAILIALLGVFAIVRTPTDIFPNIKIPVVATVWRYSGLSPDEMATRLVLGSERGTQVTVNDVEHSESQSLSGIGVVKFFFQPNASEELSYAQITAMSQTGLAFAPPGTTPPYVLAYNASTVPVLQLALSSEELSEATIFDLVNNILRTALATVPGATMPWPYGGLQRQVQIDLGPDALRAHGLSGNDVTAARHSRRLGRKCEAGRSGPATRVEGSRVCCGNLRLSFRGRAQIAMELDRAGASGCPIRSPRRRGR